MRVTETGVTLSGANVRPHAVEQRAQRRPRERERERERSSMSTPPDSELPPVDCWPEDTAEQRADFERRMTNLVRERAGLALLPDAPPPSDQP